MCMEGTCNFFAVPCVVWEGIYMDYRWKAFREKI